MNENAAVLFVLCSHLEKNDQIKPLEPREWSALATALMENHLEPQALLQLSRDEFADAVHADGMLFDRIQALLDREASLMFALNSLRDAGIDVVTRADPQYPKRLKDGLGNTCPPLFYYAGDLSLLEKPAVGYAGSRSADEADIQITAGLVQKTVQHGYIVVSGGAKGVDTAAETAALEHGGEVVSFLSDSMLRKIKVSRNLQALRNQKMLLLSVVNPDAGFQAGTAMMRNRYIYIQSQAVIVVRSDYNKGGTWSGAADSLKHQWTPVLCLNLPGAPGNQALLKKGALPIDPQWNGDLERLLADHTEPRVEQLSLFGG